MVTLEERAIHDLKIALEDVRALLQFSAGTLEERIAKTMLRIQMVLDANATDRARAIDRVTLREQSAAQAWPLAWRWRTLEQYREDGDLGEWNIETKYPVFINSHHHEVEPIFPHSTRPAR